MRLDSDAPVPKAGPGLADPGPTENRDTLELLRRARQRQTAFEHARRSEFPTTWADRVERCDERVGRFCLVHDEEDYDPPPEPPEVRRKRTGLIALLDSARRVLPGNDWLTGQHVRYLVQAGRLDEARRSVRACRATRWWCRALLGYALHHAGDPRAAERAFDRALGVMGSSRRCRWKDLAPLLEGDLENRYRRRSCRERRRLQARIWWLADPLYLLPGNDRRAEHFARRVRARMHRDAASPWGVEWGDDLAEILLRYGWPPGWQRAVTAEDPRGSVVGRYRGVSRRYLPPPEVAAAPFLVKPEDWELDPEEPRSQYDPGYLEAHGRLEAQVARFRRTGSGVVVAAYRLLRPEDGPPVPEARDAGAGLFLSSGPDGGTGGAADPATVDRAGGVTGTLRARSPPGRRLLSLEVRAGGMAARLRHGVRLRSLHGGSPTDPRSPALSDLLVARSSTDTAPAELAALLPAASAGLRFRPGALVALYWEVYGADRGEALHTSVTLRKEGAGLLREVGEFLGLVGERRPSVRAEWTEHAEGGKPWQGRSLVVRLPPTVEAGRYRLSVTVRPEDGEPRSATREVRVEEGPG